MNKEGNKKKYEEINLHNYIQEWETARQNRENFTNDFPSLDNLVDGIPLHHQENAPYVGDTTLAGLVREIPRASLQQLPVFSSTVNGSKNNVKAQVCSYFLRRVVFNKDTFGKGLLSTLQMGAEQALTHGYAPFMTATGTMSNKFGTSMRLLHYADVDPEPGIQDANEAGYFYVSANLTRTRVKEIKKKAEKNPNTSWRVDKLEELLKMEPDGKNYSQHKSDAESRPQEDSLAGTYQFVTRYEVGQGGRFMTFCEQIPDCPLRVIKNKSKFGYPRINFLVIDPAPLTPFGLSRVRLASPNQNMANIFYQNIASMLILNSKPPVLKRGKFTKPVQLKQGAVWEAQDQNAQAELVSMDNGALQSFKPLIEHLSQQIQSMMGTPFSSVNPGASDFSKTGPGVRQQNRVMDLSTNQITNILENFLRQYALVALDTYIAEQTIENTIDPETGEEIKNEDVITLDDEAKNAINRIAPNTVGEDNKITVNWNDFYDGIEDWTVEIELSMSKDELEERKRGDLQDTLTVLAQNSEVLGPQARQKVQELTDMLLEEAVPEAKRLSPSNPPMPVQPQPVENQQMSYPPMQTPQ